MPYIQIPKQQNAITSSVFLIFTFSFCMTECFYVLWGVYNFFLFGCGVEKKMAIISRCLQEAPACLETKTTFNSIWLIRLTVLVAESLIL